jgi:CheY-like chemotaxis protein
VVKPLDGSGVTVLIVDDDEESRRTIRRLVESFGVRAITAGGGEEALELALTHRPDLVLCDLQMPRMDGYEVARALRADARLPRMLVIAVTGLVTFTAVSSSLDAGFDGHVVKPLTRDILGRLLDRLTGAGSQEGPA